MTLDRILEEIKKANSIVILTHENPDGDAMGSSLALYGALLQMGKKPDIIIPSYSRTYEFLPWADQIKEKSDVNQYDLAISLDCASIKLLNGWASYFEDAKSRVVIDHHGTNGMYGDYNYVDPTAPACCQELFIVLQGFGVEIDKEIGSCLLTGIITDTGGFQYSGVSSETLEVASELLGKGVNLSQIYKKVLSTHSKPSFKLRQIALDRLEFLEDGKITFTYITLEDEKKVNAETGDYEGIVEEGRNIEGVEVSIFLHDAGEKGFKVSLRSNDYVNVSDAAMMFGGGGHPRAAGCNIKGTPEQIKRKIVNEIKQQLK